MTYIGLGPRTVTAAKDNTGRNTGNWTNAFTAQSLGFFVSQYECYHMIVNSVPAGAQGSLFLGANAYGFTFPNAGTEGDPAQPMLLNPGTDLNVFWNVAATGTPVPVVTAWFRYDPAVPGNSY